VLFQQVKKILHAQYLSVGGAVSVKRPFEGGGIQQGRIVNFPGRYIMGYSSVFNDVMGAAGSTGPFYREANAISAPTDRGLNGDLGSSSKVGFGFDPSRMVLAGPDVAGTNISVTYWRRVS
jgi:hypothetical protein